MAINIHDLVRKALFVEDFEEGGALIELKRNDKNRACDVALQILEQKIGDEYYRASAFETLYSSSIEKSLIYMEKNAVSESPYVLGAMLDCVTIDSGVLEGRENIMKAVAILKQAISLRKEEDFMKIDAEKKWFDETYP